MIISYKLDCSTYNTISESKSETWLYKLGPDMNAINVPTEVFIGTEDQLKAYLKTL